MPSWEKAIAKFTIKGVAVSKQLHGDAFTQSNKCFWLPKTEMRFIMRRASSMHRVTLDMVMKNKLAIWIPSKNYTLFFFVKCYTIFPTLWDLFRTPEDSWGPYKTLTALKVQYGSSWTPEDPLKVHENPKPLRDHFKGALTTFWYPWRPF